MAKDKKSKTKKEKKVEFIFHYKKLENYRSYYIDGVLGGISPSGKIYMEPFLDRGPTPLTITQLVDKSGQIGEEVAREGKEGLIRQIECGLTFDIPTAIKIRDWLDEKIKLYEKATDKTIKKGKK